MSMSLSGPAVRRACEPKDLELGNPVPVADVGQASLVHLNTRDDQHGLRLASQQSQCAHRKQRQSILAGSLALSPDVAEALGFDVQAALVGPDDQLTSLAAEGRGPGRLRRARYQMALLLTLV